MDIKTLFKTAVQKKASDLHILVGKPPILRIDGSLLELKETPYVQETVEEAVYSILTPLQRKMFEDDRELDISYDLKNYGRFRVNLHFERESPGMVARVVSTNVPTMDELSMPPITKKFT